MTRLLVRSTPAVNAGDEFVGHHLPAAALVAVSEDGVGVPPQRREHRDALDDGQQGGQVGHAVRRGSEADPSVVGSLGVPGHGLLGVEPRDLRPDRSSHRHPAPLGHVPGFARSRCRVGGGELLVQQTGRGSRLQCGAGGLEPLETGDQLDQVVLAEPTRPGDGELFDPRGDHSRDQRRRRDGSRYVFDHTIANRTY
ncbi:hypothetical protein [Nakamurella leprariae]|uniref:hypothetical protein n=1 Tax=Nakamurella leprariae TaxID=2803911 RepID=UPI001F33895F|nr:hypothetical protein [Nakamurella leprariae]